MVGRKIKIGTVMVAAIAASLTMFPTSAFADYGPSSGDVVGAGSDTLQQLGDFVADGDFTGDSGYNTAGNKNKFISVDATADANVRLAYSTGGLGGTSNPCAPGAGGTAGTGNAASTHADSPCTLNPTVVLRAGFSPEQRPNGSGAGYNLLVQDTNSSGTGKGVIDFSRASSARVKTSGETRFDSVTVGSDPFAMLSAATTNAVALSAGQLTSIYNCSQNNWSAFGGPSAPIVALMPQIGSGTRTSFETAIGLTDSTLGSCVVNVEENDPEAISASSSPINAIEPMSGGRLNLFQGKLSDGTSNGVGGFFKDPSCPFNSTESTAPAPCVGTAATLAPAVKYWTTGTPTSGTLFSSIRPLYIYFRDADINSAKAFQPGSTLNWVRTMLYNPCSGAGHTTGCVTIGTTTYGPGGAPYFADLGQAAISASGITPTYAFTAAGP